MFILIRRLRNGTESLLSKEDRLLTAGELQRLNRDRKEEAAVRRSRGVCEICNVIYDNIFQVCLFLICPDNNLMIFAFAYRAN